ncbi:MAG: glutamate racemase [bacterium]|nr:glutamate racemase [bacterium]
MIGIFDSGVGGLTVVKEVMRQLPEYRFVYFGDTARTPYGNKSPETVATYALQDARFLLEQGAKMIIIACHTASSVAAEILKRELPVPVFEVTQPAIRQALAVTTKNRIGVIGTSATIASQVFQNGLRSRNRDIHVETQACPLFVPLVEENWMKRSETKIIAKRYLRPLKLKQIDTLVLACTHYPIMRQVIQQVIGKRVRLVDPAETVASQVKQYLLDHQGFEAELARDGEDRFYLSDVTDKNKLNAERWLERRIVLRKHLLE